MTEEEFDSAMQARPFGTADAARLDAESRRSMALGAALWGRSFSDLERQLLAACPEIPAGFELADFRRLQRQVESIAAMSRGHGHAWLPRWMAFSHTISVGTQTLTLWEARCEIVRRAIEYLEGR